MDLSVKTSKKDQVIDITEKINRFVSQEDFEEGLCNVFVKHTTCAITTADLDPGTDKDLLNFLLAGSPSISYNHPHDPSHAPDHILSSIIGPGITVPVSNGKLDLGVWQKVVLVELNGPRERKINLSFIET
jgi:secondary thiamine-phosphate synthase enzyme